MAARAPSGFTQYIDKSGLVPRKQVLYGPPNDTLNDQHFMLDKDECVFSSFWYHAYTDSAAFVELARWRLYATLMCGAEAAAATRSSYAWCVYAWGDAGVTAFQVRLTENIGGSTQTLTVNAAIATRQWRGWGADVLLYNDGTENEIQLDARVSGGGGNIYILGLGVFKA